MHFKERKCTNDNTFIHNKFGSIDNGVCMYVCMYNMYVYMFICMYVCVFVCMYICHAPNFTKFLGILGTL